MQAVLLIDPVPGAKGVFTPPKVYSFFPDEPMDSLENIGPYKKERGKLRQGDVDVEIDVYTQKAANVKWHYALVSDLEDLI
jgi:hypothetical protein